MSSEPSAPPLVDTYTKVWNACLALWPLFLVQLIFAILQYATLILCLFFLFGPFIENQWDQIRGILQQGPAMDFSPLSGDAKAYFLNGDWIGIFFGAVLLYVFWWILLSAFSNGGTFGVFGKYFRTGELFTWRGFFGDGARFFLPMILLFVFFFFLTCALTLGFALAGFFILGLLALLHPGLGLGLVFGFLFGAPALLGLVVLAFLFTAFNLTCKACLTRLEGIGVWAAVGEAFTRIREDRWQMGTGLGVAMLTYLVVSVLMRLSLQALGLFPGIGILFKVAGVLGSLLLAVFLVVYLPALSVALLVEKEETA